MRQLQGQGQGRAMRQTQRERVTGKRITLHRTSSPAGVRPACVASRRTVSTDERFLFVSSMSSSGAGAAKMATVSDTLPLMPLERATATACSFRICKQVANIGGAGEARWQGAQRKWQ